MKLGFEISFEIGFEQVFPKRFCLGLVRKFLVFLYRTCRRQLLLQCKNAPVCALQFKSYLRYNGSPNFPGVRNISAL